MAPGAPALQITAATWAPLPPELQRAGYASAVYKDYILVVGGRAGYGVVTTFHNDVWAYNTLKNSWRQLCEAAPFAARANHACSVVGEDLYVIGGSNAVEVFSDVHVFNLRSRQWSVPTLRGATQLLHRTAHSSCLYPARTDSIMIFGGYGCAEGGGGMVWMSDLVLLNTLRKEVTALGVSGPVPEMRGYHTFTALGQRCYAVGGRTTHNYLVEGSEVVAVFDVPSRRWLPSALPAGAALPSRSSHRVAAFGDSSLLIFGGASLDGRLCDMYCLHADPDSGKLSCQDLSAAMEAAAATAEPVAGGDEQQAQLLLVAPRASHVMELVNGRIFIIGGYGKGKTFIADLWCFDVGLAQPAPPAPPERDVDVGARGSGEAAQWRQTHRKGRGGAVGEVLGPPNKRQRAAKTPEKAKKLLLGRSPHKAAAAPAAAAKAAAPAGGAGAAAMSPPRAATRQLEAAVPAAGALRAGCPVSCQAAVALVAEVGQLRADVEGRQEAELGGLRQEVVALQEERARLTSELAIASGNYHDAQQERDSLKRALEEERAAGKAALHRAQQQADEEVREAAAIFNREKEGLAAALRDKEALLAQAEAEAESLRGTMRRERAEWEAASLQRSRHVERLSLDLSIARESGSRLADQLHTSAKQAQQLQDQLQAKEGEVAAARREAADEREQLRREVEKERSAAELVQREAESLQQRVAAAAEAAKQVQADLARLQEQLREAEDRAARHSADAARAQGEAAQLRAEAAGLRERLRGDKSEEQQEIRLLEQQLAAKKRRFADKHGEAAGC